MIDYDDLIADLQESAAQSYDELSTATIDTLNRAVEAIIILQGHLIEAMARCEVMSDGGGDYGGPFHTNDAHAVDMYVRYVEPCHSDPPDWDQVHDPLLEEVSDEIWKKVSDRERIIRSRVRAQVQDYADRTGHFKTWWRKRRQLSAGSGTEEP